MGKPIKFSDQDKRWNQRGKERKFDVRPEREHILIVCEGERTEPYYFDAIRLSLPRHVAEVRIEGKGMNTISLVKEAMRLRDIHCDSDHPYDQTWAVFDKDDFPKDDFDNAIAMCGQHGLMAAYSNQAFELWFVLHFEDRQTGMHRDEYMQCLSKHLDEIYVKNDPDMYDKLRAHGSEAEAIRRAKRLHESAEKPASAANPCTTVYELIEKLNSFKPEYEARER
ncbi:MAG: RloB family protein [Candidatus Sumerlaeota bacterium]|nr:RloB family protein [Candidatus Sumerlaeota bacterium]